MRGCASHVAQLFRTKLTLYLAFLHHYDVAFHVSSLLDDLGEVSQFACGEADAAHMLLTVCMASGSGSWPVPEGFTARYPDLLERGVPKDNFVQALPYLNQVSILFEEWVYLWQQGFAHDASWPLYALLTKVHHLVLHFVKRALWPWPSALLPTLLNAPEAAGPLDSFRDTYLHSVWFAVHRGEHVPRQRTLSFLTAMKDEVGALSNATGMDAVGVATAFFALADCCPDVYGHFAVEAAWYHLMPELSWRSLLAPWPVWNFADRAALPRWVTMRAPTPYALAVLPFREKVSDFVRACQRPYCDLAFFDVAKRLAATGAAGLSLAEAGANLGDCSFHMLGIGVVRHATLFEAVPCLVQRLQATVQRNHWANNVSIVPYAVGASDGVEVLVHTGRRFGNWAELGSHDVYKQQDPDSVLVVQSRVQRTTVDAHVGPVDLLKVATADTIRVTLEGAGSVVSRARAVYVSMVSHYAADPPAEARTLVRWLRTRGLEPEVVDAEEGRAAEDAAEEAARALKPFSVVGWRDLEARRAPAAPRPGGRSGGGAGGLAAAGSDGDDLPLAPACLFGWSRGQLQDPASALP